MRTTERRHHLNLRQCGICGIGWYLTIGILWSAHVYQLSTPLLVLLSAAPWVPAFADFPPFDPSSEHLSHTEYLAYLERYVNHFNLEPHLHFSHTAQRVAPAEDGGWMVTVRNDVTGGRPRSVGEGCYHHVPP